MWLDFSDPAEREKRDLYRAPTKQEHDRELLRSAQRTQDLARKRVTHLGVIPDDTVVSIDHMSKLYERRPDLFESDEEQPPARGRKPSQHLTRHQFYNLWEAVQYANYRGYVMNFELTICWQKAGYATPDDVEIGFNHFIERLRKFCEYRRKPYTYYYAVIENGPSVGYHSHMHLHFPRKLHSKLIDWIRDTLTTPDGQPFPKSCYDFDCRQDHDTEAQWFWFQYVVKALDPRFKRKERLIAQHHNFKTFNQAAGVKCRSTGPIAIKRVRIAQVIARTKRRKTKYYVNNVFFLRLEERYGSHEYERGRRDRIAKLPPGTHISPFSDPQFGD
jgi:hypothetical protein